jgi:5-deoxy-glucuronate isomerase
VTGGLHLAAGAAADGPYALSVTPQRAGWGHAGLRVLDLPPGGTHSFATAGEEMIVLPLRGSCLVRVYGGGITLTGRPDVFAGRTDFAYLPPGTQVEVSSQGGGRFAVPSAAADPADAGRYPARYQPASEVPVELRGAGACSRQVNNFCMPGVFGASRLIACEVLTPAGNWSSYPPHKHDEQRPGESVLEEIYYFEIAPGPGGDRAGAGFQRVYGSAARPVDVLAEVRTGDVVLVPHGWHGPSMAAPGYDMYYLNVMAGPGPERAWLTSTDPAHAWVRDTWAGQPGDPRLPVTGAERG